MHLTNFSNLPPLPTPSRVMIPVPVTLDLGD